MVSTLSFRKSNWDDLYFLFELANDSDVRKNSFFSKKISVEEHVMWYKSKLNDENANYLIAEFNTQKMAFIRFDINKDRALIGINILKKFRGKKLATIIIEQACEKFLRKKNIDIIALIKKTNVASIKAFEKANFRFERELIVENSEAFEYKFNTL
jgi:UDP-2,4-diacetamido-2,4,6-trideoxy-beta-L-altropyranose hydrolase